MTKHKNQCWGSGSACFWASPDPDPLVRGTDPGTDPDPSFSHIQVYRYRYYDVPYVRYSFIAQLVIFKAVD
jgi:hypothetical protein